jgi:hypothetical protein
MQVDSTSYPSSVFTSALIQKTSLATDQLDTLDEAVARSSTPTPPSSTSGPSGVFGASAPGWGPYFSWNLQTYLPGKFEGVS